MNYRGVQTIEREDSQKTSQHFVGHEMSGESKGQDEEQSQSLFTGRRYVDAHIFGKFFVKIQARFDVLYLKRRQVDKSIF